jgi:para-nitrobenzyl esterase
MRTLRIALLSLLVITLVAISTIVSSCAGEDTSVRSWTSDATVQTLFGPVKGFKYEDTWTWKAIPYARPPVGELRWKAPQDPETWTKPREGKKFCSQCPQYTINNLATSAVSVTGSEDCLYLNIWRPQSKERDLPVYFWIHGGGNSLGTASYDGYDGTNIARESSLVVVTVNYRIGPLGWFTHPALHGGQLGSELDDSGNYGTLDLIKALEWVHDNIAAFGGDPGNVTIAGESAGAINVFSLLISPLASGLFHRAIAQSGMPVATPVAVGEASAREVLADLLMDDGTVSGREAAEAHLSQMSNTDIAAYLRSKTPAQLLAGYESTVFGMISLPFIFEDGTVIPESGFDTLDTGEYANKIPIILGSNKEETKLFLFMDPAFQGKDALYQKVTSATSDLWKAIGVDELARKLRSHPDQPDVYVYQFLWGSGGDLGQSVIPDPWGFKLGACHSLDVPFFFGNDIFIEILDTGIFTEENKPGREALSDTMMVYVAQFARTGDPNPSGSNLPQWQPWTNADGELKCMLLDADMQAAKVGMSDIELTPTGVIAATDREVFELIDSLAAQFVLRFVEWG